jgi:hypothetical protein
MYAMTSKMKRLTVAGLSALALTFAIGPTGQLTLGTLAFAEDRGGDHSGDRGKDSRDKGHDRSQDRSGDSGSDRGDSPDGSGDR